MFVNRGALDDFSLVLPSSLRCFEAMLSGMPSGQLQSACKGIVWTSSCFNVSLITTRWGGDSCCLEQREQDYMCEMRDPDDRSHEGLSEPMK